MHSMMEGEGGSDPQDVFVEIGTLIVEGRVPGGGSVRGYSEGPHCAVQGLSNVTHRHLCNPQQHFLCKRAENFRKHMLLLFQNNVPMCIEVVLCADCPCGVQRAQSPEVGNVPFPCGLLLEQWTVTVASRHNESAPMLAKGLMQAVRSQLHFSQLSAWWSSSKGSRPGHVSYRVTVPSQAFASPFKCLPNEHSFPLATVGKNLAIQVCVRSLPRMGSPPTVPCGLHMAASSSLPEMLQKYLTKTGPIQMCTGDVGGGATTSGAGGSSCGVGESLLDPPQRYRSPPRAAEAPDHALFRRMPGEAVGARWQGDSPPSPPMGLPGRWRRREGSCGGSESQSCARSLWKHHHDTMSALLDDRMQMECNQPGKHHCSCEGEEELEKIPTPPQVRQRRRSQVSLTAPSLPNCSTVSEASVIDDHSKRLANESNKRTSGSSVMGEEYVMYTCDGSVASSSNNSGSLKRRRPIADTGEASGRQWSDAEHTSSASSSGNAPPYGVSGTSAAALSPNKAAAAPLSRREMEEVLAVLRERSKSHIRPVPQNVQVYYTSAEQFTRINENLNCTKTNSSVPLFSLSSSAHCAKKSGKIDVAMGPSQCDCHNGRQDCFEAVRTRRCDKLDTCDRNLSDTKCGCEKQKDEMNIDRYNGEKPSYDLNQDNKNNQAICDNYTPLHNSDNEENYICLSEMSRILTCHTKEKANRQHRDEERDDECLSPRFMRNRLKLLETSPKTPEEHVGLGSRQFVPSASERALFRRSFDSAASMVFHTRTGLPLTSSPAPVRRGTTRFDYDSSLNSVSAIRSALFETSEKGVQLDDALCMNGDDPESEGGARSPCSPDVGLTFPPLVPSHTLVPCSSLLGSFEESVLNGRLEPVSTVEGFTAELGASGSFCPKHVKLPVTVFFYTLGDYDKVSTPYLGHINLGKKGYNVPKSGTIQVTLFNPMGTVIKMFVVRYDLTDMPANSHTFLRQRTLYMPVEEDITEDLPDNTQKWLRYLIHLRFLTSKSGRVYLHTDIRMIIFRKSDMDTATAHYNSNNNVDSGFELRSFTHGPGNPKFSPR